MKGQRKQKTETPEGLGQICSKRVTRASLAPKQAKNHNVMSGYAAGFILGLLGSGVRTEKIDTA